MDFLVSKEEFVKRIRSLDDTLSKIRISDIQVNKKDFSVVYNFICPKSVDDGLKTKILNEAYKVTPDIFKAVEIKITKIVSDDALINNEIYKYIKSQFPSLAIFLKLTDISSVVIDDSVKYILRTTADGDSYFKKSGAMEKLNAHLERTFCSDFIGSTEIKEEGDTVSLLNEEVYESELKKIEHRTIKVSDIKVIDEDSIGDLALYIEDVTSGEVTVCGKITSITERTGEKTTDTGEKKTYTYFLINIDDTTGRIGGIYFPRKHVYEKVKALQEGDAIICRGTAGERDGRLSFKINRLNRCTFPDGFVKKDRYKRSAPQNYKLIFPSPAETVSVKSVFDYKDTLPSEVTDKEYVVFDFETTGLDLQNNSITEIGAVRIKNGKVTEQFTTLIKPNDPISEENSKITGITEEMVKDAPRIDAVLPDFMKFIQGAVLVGHNCIEFDMRFLKKYAGANDYEVKNQVIDTCDMSRKMFPSSRHHDLQTLADRFNVKFHHHRALADSYATAEIFIELMKIKNRGEL